MSENTIMNVWPGAPYPLGATWTGEGVNFAPWVQTSAGTAAPKATTYDLEPRSLALLTVPCT